MTAATEVCTKRIYDAPATEDGFRVLVDRLWPRGMTKAKAQVNLWSKDVAPSTELRRSYHDELLDFDQFRQAYCQELDARASAWDEIVDAAGGQKITLIYAARDTNSNHALVLLDWATNRLSK